MCFGYDETVLGRTSVMNVQDGNVRNSHDANIYAENSAEVSFASLLNGSPVSDADKRSLSERHHGELALIGIASATSGQLNDDALKSLAASNLFTAAMEGHTIFALTSRANAQQAIDAIVSAQGIDECHAAISLPFRAFDEIAYQRQLVKYVLKTTNAPGVYDAKDSALAYLRNVIRSTIHTDSLIHPALYVIADYDRANQSNLLNTLRVYLENDCNAQKCGRILFLHRNSLVYRIRRIQEISGCNLSDPEERAYLRLSFLLYQ